MSLDNNSIWHSDGFFCLCFYSGHSRRRRSSCCSRLGLGFLDFFWFGLFWFDCCRYCWSLFYLFVLVFWFNWKLRAFIVIIIIFTVLNSQDFFNSGSSSLCLLSRSSSPYSIVFLFVSPSCLVSCAVGYTERKVNIKKFFSAVIFGVETQILQWKLRSIRTPLENLKCCSTVPQ